MREITKGKKTAEHSWSGDYRTQRDKAETNHKEENRITRTLRAGIYQNKGTGHQPTKQKCELHTAPSTRRKEVTARVT
jgi:hypothetical protein